MKTWLDNLLGKQPTNNKAILGVSLTASNASWCLLEPDEGGKMCIRKIGLLEKDFDSPVIALKKLINDTLMPRADCYITLGSEYYDMLLVDAPEVPDSEIRDAVRWKVKDLIEGSIEQCTIDIFRLPSDAYRGRLNMLYAAVVPTALIESIVETCDNADLILKSISVNEMAMKHVARELSSSADAAVAILYTNGTTGTINLIENNQLYLTRKLEISNERQVFNGRMDFVADPTENLFMDVKRSLDYYESQLGKSGISELYIAPANKEQAERFAPLRERLPLNTEMFKFPDSISADHNYAAASAAMVAPALGAALGAWHGSH